MGNIYRNHRITEWLSLEGILKITQFQPLPLAGYPPLAQAAQGPIQPDFERHQGWSIHKFSGQPVQRPHHPLSKEFSPNI